MKRILTCFIVIACLLCGCSHAAAKIHDPVNFYYCANPVSFNTTEGVIAHETRDAKGVQSNDALLAMYLKGPVNDQFSSPFPAGTQIISVETANNKCVVTLNDSFAELTGVDLSIACSCLSMTLMELTGADSVEIKVVDRELFGQKSVTITKDSLLLFDSSASEANQPQE